ncbi:MAG: hypothetical protein ACYTFM_12485, partial [Planctomycetota bacterium]
MDKIEHLSGEHKFITRRYFMQLCAMGVAVPNISELYDDDLNTNSHFLLNEDISKLEYLTRDENFINYGRGTPPPHELPREKLREVGQVPETWQLEVLPDPESNSDVQQPLSKKLGTALNWDGLMKMAEK